MEVFSKSDIGLVRSQNQDDCRFGVISPSCVWAVVCDGMGGAKGGNIASATLAEELLELAMCGATLCDVMGDLFDRQSDEMAKDTSAIKKQMALIDTLHNAGASVLMSSHIYKFTPAERVLEIAKEQQRRGVDICKIVTGADTMAEQIENLRIITMLKESLDIPFLFLAGGECTIHRRLGGHLGNCMTLCVYEHDHLSTSSQPLLRNMKIIRDNLDF